jgi:hypothetical protein
MDWNQLVWRSDDLKSSDRTSPDRRLREGFGCLHLIIVDIEDRQQLGDLEKIADALREACEFNGSSRVARAGVERDESAEASAIDVAHIVQIEHNFRGMREQLLHGVAQAGRLLAENEAAAAVDDHHAIDGASAHSELHGQTSLNQGHNTI